MNLHNLLIEPSLFWQLIVFLTVCGMCIGSFLNVVVYRVPLGLSVVTPRSACIHCHKPIPWFGLTPVFGYFVLKAQCKHCHSRISIHYPLLEAFVGATTALLFFLVLRSVHTLQSLMLEYGLTLWLFYVGLVLARIDTATKTIPNNIVLPGILVSVILGFLAPSVGWKSSLFAVALSLVTTLIVKVTFSAAGRTQNLGYGDSKYMLLIAAAVGLKGFVLSLGIACGCAVIIALWKRKSKTTLIPFGGCLAIGSLVGRMLSIMV